MKKKILLIFSTLIGAVLLLSGGVLGAYMYNISVPHFDNYGVSPFYFGSNTEAREMQEENGYGVFYPDFWYTNNMSVELMDCYNEVQEPMTAYAQYVACRYDNRARLYPEVEYTKTRLTISFTGYGVLEDGTREDLARTYIFDIENAGRNKLPKLLNKAEIYPEILL